MGLLRRPIWLSNQVPANKVPPRWAIPLAKPQKTALKPQVTVRPKEGGHPQLGRGLGRNPPQLTETESISLSCE